MHDAPPILERLGIDSGLEQLLPASSGSVKINAGIRRRNRTAMGAGTNGLQPAIINR